MTGISSVASGTSEEGGGVSGRVENSSGAPAGSKKDALAFERCRRFRGTSSVIGLSGWQGEAHREVMVDTTGESVRPGLSGSDGDGDGGVDTERSRLDKPRRNWRR